MDSSQITVDDRYEVLLETEQALREMIKLLEY